MNDLFDGVGRLSAGQQASLKRAAGRPLREADAAALQAFFTAVPPQKPYEREKAFAVVCGICLWKSEQRSNTMPFAECMHLLRLKKGADGCDGLDARFRNLIDTAWNDDDGYMAAKLTRMLKLLKSSEIACPDPEGLFADLKNWDHPERFVQRRWMEAYLSLKTDRADDNASIEEAKEINE